MRTWKVLFLRSEPSAFPGCSLPSSVGWPLAWPDDPRQKRAVEELNAQGRLKAQFLTNAILHYVEGTATLPPQEELESILERLMKRMLDDRADMSAKPTEKIDSSEPFSADDLATIAGTLQAFRR